MSKHSESANSQAIDVVVVGAGFAGIYLIHKLRGQGLTVRAIERGSDVGGTWFWNRYPGARCDIESLDYSYSFDEAIQQEWTWSERFATQPEILRYANWVADRLDIRRHVTFNTTVSAATYDERLGAWTVETGDGAKITARFLILATGALSVGTIPSIEGNERFRGATYHTGSWPREGVNFSGKRVAVIGTGSSGVQSIPIIARQADLTYVLQRTPNYCIPARNRFYSEAEIEQAKARYPERRAVAKYNSGGVYRVDSALCGVEVDAKERELAYWKAWEVGGLGFIKAFGDTWTNEETNRHMPAFVRERIRDTIVDDDTADRLAPTTYPIGTKRPCVDTDYYATFNLPNVELVDINQSPITAFTETAIVVGDRELEIDAVVYATGFDALTGAIKAIDITGRNGLKLRDEWHAGPRTYLGMLAAGFPNMFLVAGAGGPAVLTNVLATIEQNVEWIADCIADMGAHGHTVIEATVQAQEDWVEELFRIVEGTLFPRAASWYMGANIPGKPRVFMPYAGGLGEYRRRCERVAAEGYPGFVFEERANLAKTA